jgi:magnesium and cobalt transporter
MNADELDTVGGVIVQAFGRMPKVGENIDIDIFKFRISEGNDRQVKLLEMQVMPNKITS